MSLALSAMRRCVCTATLFATVLGTTLPLVAAEKPRKAAATEEMKPGYGPQPAQETLDLGMYARIRSEGLQHSHVMDYMSGLSDGIGPRLTGSPNMKKANEWTRDRLTDAGLTNAHLEDWGEFGMGWAQVNSWARLISPDTEPLWLQAAPWSPATRGAVTADAILVDPTTVADLDKYKGKLAGKIVLLGAPHPMVDLTEPLFHRYTAEELKDMEGPEEERRGAGERRDGDALGVHAGVSVSFLSGLDARGEAPMQDCAERVRI